MGGWVIWAEVASLFLDTSWQFNRLLHKHACTASCIQWRGDSIFVTMTFPHFSPHFTPPQKKTDFHTPPNTPLKLTPGRHIFFLIENINSLNVEVFKCDKNSLINSELYKMWNHIFTGMQGTCKQLYLWASIFIRKGMIITGFKRPGRFPSQKVF